MDVKFTIKSNLKPILAQRKISIREFSRMIDYNYENVRKLVNDDSTHFPRELLARTCQALNIGVNELLVLSIKGMDSDNKTHNGQ